MFKIVDLYAPKDHPIWPFIISNLKTINDINLVIKPKITDNLSLACDEKVVYLNDIDDIKMFLLSGEKKVISDNEFYEKRKAKFNITKKGDKPSNEEKEDKTSFDEFDRAFHDSILDTHNILDKDILENR